MKARPSFAILAAVVAALLLLPAVASAACPNEAIREAQVSSVPPGGSTYLPDCMAIEMVSTPKKENQYAKVPEVSADGERVRYYSGGAIGDPPNLLSAFWNRYVASRGDSGWITSSTAPLDPTLNHGAGFGYGEVFSPDFSRWFHAVAARLQSQLGNGGIYQGGLGGLLSPLSPFLTPIDPGTHWEGTIGSADLQGASADHSHFYFNPGANFPGSANDKRTAYLPGDPEPVGPEAMLNAYVALRDAAGEPSLELLARDGEGKAWGGKCGAGVGGIDGSDLERNQGAISADGSRVYFTTRPSQPPTGNCDTAANKRRILKRLETSEGPWITQLFTSECDRVSPPCATVDGDDLYQGASVDGTKVYFTTNRQLADTDLDGEFFGGCTGFLLGGCDLYLYDSAMPAGQRLTQVSAGETNASHEAGKEAKVLTGIPAISADGSHAYFAAEGVLTDEPNPEGAVAQTGQRNLYLYQRDAEHPEGRLAFIGTVDSSDFGFARASSTFRGTVYPVPATAKDSAGKEIGGDGHVLLFQTRVSLTADDTDGGFVDVFRYDSEAEELERVSVAAPGGEDNGTFGVTVRPPPRIGATLVNSTNGTDYAEMGRWVSEDGETVVFTTAEGLVPEDQNGFMDSYLVRNGDLYRIPGTTDPFDPTEAAALRDRPVLSHDGSTVAFTSRDLLLPSDGDTAVDVYALRVNGGYPIEPDPHVCFGEECQGPVGAAPAGANAASAGTPSVGNVKPKPSGCPKGKRKMRRAGKVRCVPKKAGKAKKAKRNKRAGREQGGQK